MRWVQPARDSLPRCRFLRGGHGVFEVDDHRIRARRARLWKAIRTVSGHKQIRVRNRLHRRQLTRLRVCNIKVTTPYEILHRGFEPCRLSELKRASALKDRGVRYSKELFIIIEPCRSRVTGPIAVGACGW